MGPLRENSGFKLIELMLVLALMGTVGALAMPMFRRALDRVTADSMLDDFRDALATARSSAIAARRPTRVHLDPLTGRWEALIWRPEEKAFAAFGGRRRSGHFPKDLAYDASTDSFVFYPDGSAEACELTVRTSRGDDVGRLTVSPLTGASVWSAHGQ